MAAVRDGSTIGRVMNGVKIHILHKHGTINKIYQTLLRVTVRLHCIRGTSRRLLDRWMLRIMSNDDRGHTK
jgi:hypothetical protein